MSVEVIKVSFMRKIAANFKKKSIKNMLPYIFTKIWLSGHFKFIENNDVPEAKGLKLAIDHLFDLNLVSNLLKKMEKNHIHYNWKEIVNLYLKYE